MIHRILIVLCLIAALMACEQQKNTYRLSDEELSNLMLDLHLSETMMISLTTPQQDSFKNLFWEKLTTVYQLSEEQIKDEVALLESDPKKLKIIMDQINFRSDSIN